MRLTFAAFVAISFAFGGCASFQATTPKQFAELEDQEPQYDYRATTPDGVVLAVRVLDNEPRADESFWAKAIELKLRTMGGYALLDTRDVKCKTGLGGKQYRFGHDEGARPHLYWLTVFVTKKRIFVLEAGGAKDLVQREASAIDAFVADFRPR